MSKEESNPPGGAKTYTIGNIGAGARVMVGEHQTWIEQHRISSREQEDVLKRFDALLQRLLDDDRLDEAQRELSIKKVEALADSVVGDQPDEGKVRLTMLDAKNWFASTVSWAWDEVKEILQGEAAQKLLSGVAKTGVKAAVATLLG